MLIVFWIGCHRWGLEQEQLHGGVRTLSAWRNDVDKTVKLLTSRGRLGGPIELAVPLSSSDVCQLCSLISPLLYLDVFYSSLNMYLHPVSLCRQ